MNYSTNQVIRPSQLQEGQRAQIVHWVNQPQYVGQTLEIKSGEFVRTNKNGIATSSVDSRHLHLCKVQLIKGS